MKNIVLLFTVIIFKSCSEDKITNEASFEFNNAWYLTANYSSNATEQDLKEYARSLSNPDQTSYFFFYPDSIDAGIFNREKFTFETYKGTLLGKHGPTYSYYKMPTDDDLNEDALSLLDY